MIKLDEITDDTPLPLGLAAKLFFPHGDVTISTLRREHYKGRLTIEKVGGRCFVTKRAIDDMRRRSRVSRELDTPEPPAARAKASPAASDNVAYAREVARRLKKGLPMPGQEPAKTAEIKPFKPKA